MEILHPLWQGVIGFFGYVQNLGVSVVMPIILFAFGIILRAGVGKSLRAGLTVGVGFIGLNLVIGLMGDNLGPAVQQMSERFGLSLSVIDVGWPAAAAIAFASQVGAVAIPVCLVVNIIMLLFNATQTIDIDIWDYWHFAFTGALVAILTGSQTIGIVAMIFNEMIILVLGDYTAPGLARYNDLPGISLPHGFTAAFVPTSIVLNKIIDLIPGLNKVEIDMSTLQKRFGVFGEPILVGTVLGLIIGFVAGKDSAGTLALGVTLGAVLVLIPKMAAMLMEGLIPISDAASEFITKRFQNRGKIYIGLDSAVGIGHPTALAVSLVLVPLAVFVAVLLPGNRVLPFADLAVFPWMFVLIIPIVKNNGFRALIIGFLTVAVGLWIATDLAPSITQAAVNANFAIPAGADQISSICDGANPLTWAIYRFHGLGYIGIIIVGAIAVAMSVVNRFRIIKEAKALRSAAS
jgi:PTS system galactitol-specific IIC component